MKDFEIEQKPEDEKTITVIVNGREREVDNRKITYQEVVELAFAKVTEDPNIIYTVTYSKGNKPDKGTMVKGDTVTVKRGMIFNVTRTDKS